MSKSNKQALQRWFEHREAIHNATVINTDEDVKTKQERKQRLLKDYDAFCRYYFPHYCTAPAAPFHKRMAKRLLNSTKAFLVLAWPRFHAKSTHASLMAPLFLYFNSEIKCMILASKSEEKANKLLSDIQAELLDNQRIINDFGEQHKMGSWEEGEFTTSGGCLFKAVGKKQSPRGLRQRQHRPDYIVVDDIDDDEEVKNPRRVSESYEWLMSALFGAFSPKRWRFVAVGNVIGKESILTYLAENAKSQYEQINALDKNGKPAWHEHYTKQDIKDMMEAMGHRNAQKELFHNPITEGAVFKRDWMQWKYMRSFKEYRYLIAYTDPSLKSSSKADYKATVLVGLTGKEMHIIRAFVDQTSIKRMIDWHYDLYESVSEGNTLYMYMESNFWQDILFDEFMKEGQSRGYHLPISGDTRKKPDKFQRVENISPYFERGLIYFNQAEKNNPNMQRLIDQLLMFEKGSKAPDDAPDALEGAIFKIQEKARTKVAPDVGHLKNSTKRY